MPANEEMIRYWNEVAGAKWVANQRRLDRLMAPLTEALLAAAKPMPGDRVVEIGCGCGDLTLRLAALEGAGPILAVDVSRPMLAHAEARRSATLGSLAPIDWIAADASTAAFAPTHSLLVSRFGVMFFDDKPRAFGNLRASLDPEGRFAFVCWRARSQVEWMREPLAWIAPLLPTPDEPGDEPGPFGLADEVRTRAMLLEAGFADVRAEKLDRPLVMGEGEDDAAAVDEAVAMLAETGPAAALMRDAEPKVRQEALALLRRGLGDRVDRGRVLLQGACWLYTGLASKAL